MRGAELRDATCFCMTALKAGLPVAVRQLFSFIPAAAIAWISSDYFESLLLLRGENDSKQSDEFQATAASEIVTV